MEAIQALQLQTDTKHCRITNQVTSLTDYNKYYSLLSVHWNSIVAMQLSPHGIDHPRFLSAVFNLVPKDFQPDSEKPWG